MFLKIWAVRVWMEYNWLKIGTSDGVTQCGIKFSDPKTRRHLLVVKIYQNDAEYRLTMPA